MKKIVFMITMLLCSVMSYAEDNSDNSVASAQAYELHVSMASLGRSLSLGKDQIDAVENVQRIFEYNMSMIPTYQGDSRKAMEKNTIAYCAKNMRYILTQEQYKKYMMLLNVTLNNRGLNSIKQSHD